MISVTVVVHTHYLSVIGGVQGCCRVQDSLLSKVKELRHIVQLPGRALFGEHTIGMVSA